MIIEIPMKEPTKYDKLSLAIYNTLTLHATTLISKSDARVVADLLGEYYKDHSIKDVVKKIIQGIYESDLSYKHPMNIALLSKFIRG